MDPIQAPGFRRVQPGFHRKVVFADIHALPWSLPAAGDREALRFRIGARREDNDEARIGRFPEPFPNAGVAEEFQGSCTDPGCGLVCCFVPVGLTRFPTASPVLLCWFRCRAIPYG